MGCCGSAGDGKRRQPAHKAGAGPARSAPAAPGRPASPAAPGTPEEPRSPSTRRLLKKFPGYDALDAAAARHESASRKVTDKWNGDPDTADAVLISVSQYVVDRCIAVGGQASVWQVHCGEDHARQFVLKCYSREALERERADSGMNNLTVWYEYEILTRLGQDCDAIPVVDESLLSPSHIYLVMEYVAGPQLRQHILDARFWRRRRKAAFTVVPTEDGKLGLRCRGTCVTDSSGSCATAERMSGCTWSSSGADGITCGMRLCSINRKEVMTASDVADAAALVRSGQSVEVVVSEELPPESPIATASPYSPESVFQSIVEVVKYIHDLGIAHRDLKPENIILSGGGEVHLVDFGCGAQVTAALPKATGTCSKQNSGSFGRTKQRSILLTRPLGTQPYISPEVVRTFKDLEAVAEQHARQTGEDVQGIDVCGTELQETRYRGRPYDIWSCGAILFELLTNSQLFPVGTDAKDWRSLDESLDSPRLSQLSALEPAAVDLLRKCLAASADDRPNATAVLEHPWLHRPAEEQSV